MHKKWLSPLKFGLVFGVFAGMVDGTNTIALQKYLEHHLYRTAVWTMADKVDYWMIAAVAAAFALALLVKLAGAVKGKREAAARLWMILLMLAVVATIQASDHSAEGEYPSLLAWDLLLRLLGSAAFSLLGFFLFKWIRRSPHALARFDRCVGRLITRVVDLTFVSCLVIVLVLNIFSCILRFSARASARERPNIIFIMVDTLRADHLGCYGYGVNTSPNINRLADQSLVFDKAIAQAPFTAWSVPSFWTSKYPRNSRREGPAGIREDYVTLAEALQEQGYTTSAVIGNVMVNKRTGFKHGFNSFDDTGKAASLGASSILSTANRRILESRDRRFFLFLLFMDPHSPYDLHHQYDFSSRYKESFPRQIDISASTTETSQGRELLEVYYDSEIRFVDDHIGMLFADLKERGLYDNSLIVFLSDHGEEFGEHGRFFHGATLYNQALSVPLIVKLPKQHTGRRVKGSCALIDVFPMLMNFLNYDASALDLEGSGLDLRSISRVREKDIFSTSDSSAQLRCVQRSEYKYTMKISDKEQSLFDLVKDAGETKDISSQELGIGRAMKKTLRDHENQINRQSESAERQPALTDEEKERLKSLGYLAN